MLVSWCYCVAYDWRMAVNSIKSVWPYADEILIGVDEYSKTWTGRDFNIDMRAFVDAIEATGCPLSRLRLVYEDFWRGGDYSPLVARLGREFLESAYPAASHPEALKLEAMQRQRLADMAKPDNTVVAIDSDEIVTNGAAFITWLETAAPLSFMAQWVNVYKIIGDTAIVVVAPWYTDMIPVGLRPNPGRPYYMRGRMTNASITSVSPLRLLHYTLGGRTRAEIETKLRSWGHAGERNVGEFLALWDSVTVENCTELGAYAPHAQAAVWSKLCAVPLASLV